LNLVATLCTSSTTTQTCIRARGESNNEDDG